MGHNILLVDDDELLLETYKALLELEGYTVFDAPTPYKALQIIEKNKIKLAILDYNLPNMNGVQLGHLVHKLQEEANIMFISGNDSIHELVKDAKYNVSTVLSKPIEIHYLKQSVKNLIEDPEPQTELQKQKASKVQNLIRLLKISNDKPNHWNLQNLGNISF